MPSSDHPERRFWTHLICELLNDRCTFVPDNVDRVRFPPERSFIRAVKDLLLKSASIFGLSSSQPVSVAVVSEILAADGFERTYESLQDPASKDLFVKLIAYRILGERNVRLPINTKEYWRIRRSLSGYIERSGAAANVRVVGHLDLCNVDGIRFFGHPLNVLNTFLLHQYRCSRADVGVEPGDVVIDAGGCWGDTTLYFARSAERVYSYECMPSNIHILNENIKLNPELAGKIEVVQNALWSRSGERLVFGERGPASRGVSGQVGVEVTTGSLDDLVEARSLPRLDFIKMDIEGAEMQALIGAERTIRKFRPQLAISIYHDIRDFVRIPDWIASLNLGYRFYIDHFTIHAEETVLFATADSGSRRNTGDEAAASMARMEPTHP